MNYIKHLNRTMELFYDEQKIQPTHVSLYMSLFISWNQNRFANPMLINRNEIMKAAKINSYSTYTKCIKDLMELGYIDYIPSFNPGTGSKVHMYTFCIGDCKAECTSSCTKNVKEDVQLSVQLPIINIYKQNKQGDDASPHTNNASLKIIEELGHKDKPAKLRMEVPTLLLVKDYFRERSFAESEAEKFYNYFESNGWKVGGKASMKDWRAAARNWVLNAERFSRPKPVQRSIVIKDKNYSEPL